MYREHTREVKIGDRVIGGGNPILIQSMTNTRTEDVEATVAQILRLEAAGCDIIRSTVPNMEAARQSARLKRGFISLLWRTFILTIRWRLPPWKTARIKYASIPETSAARKMWRLL